MHNRKQSIQAHFGYLQPGCLSPHLDEYTSRLTAAGYTALSIRNYRDSIAHFGTWMQRKGLTVVDINETVITAFAQHHCSCPGGRRHKRVSRRYVGRVAQFLRYLIEQGVVDIPAVEAGDRRPVHLVLFRDWMLRHRGLSVRTLDGHERLILALLPILGNEPADYNVATVRDAISTQAKRYSLSTVKASATALRAYLRFLASEGYCRAGLEMAVPTFPQWKLSALPRYLPTDELERVLTTCDQRPYYGLRDRAILLLLARLALRAGDIVSMRLEDIDWSEGTLLVHGKGRRTDLLPIPQETGDAMLVYLEQARPPVAIREVFLCAKAPYRAFPSSGVVSGIVRAALKRAGITNPPSQGAHLLRHSAATAMLRAGATLEAVGTVLRHRSVDTTAHYAKVDLAMLRPIAQPWPGDLPC